MSETMNEEKLIMDRFGNENPFRVPENYFNEFPQRIMKRIAQQKRRRRMIRWGIAAMMTGCIFSSAFILVFKLSAERADFCNIIKSKSPQKLHQEQ